MAASEIHVPAGRSEPLSAMPVPAVPAEEAGPVSISIDHERTFKIDSGGIQLNDTKVALDLPNAGAGFGNDLFPMMNGVPAFVAELNDTELLLLRDELRQIARELKAAAELRRMVQVQIGIAAQELATAY